MISCSTSSNNCFKNLENRTNQNVQIITDRPDLWSSNKSISKVKLNFIYTQVNSYKMIKTRTFKLYTCIITLLFDSGFPKRLCLKDLWCLRVQMNNDGLHTARKTIPVEFKFCFLRSAWMIENSKTLTRRRIRTVHTLKTLLFSMSDKPSCSARDCSIRINHYCALSLWWVYL